MFRKINVLSVILMITTLVSGQLNAQESKDEKPWWQFERIEPNIAEGIEQLKQGKMSDAEDSFSRAKPGSAEDRAVQNYNIGSSLLMQAQKASEKAAQQATQQQAAQAGTPQDPNNPITPPQQAQAGEAQAAKELLKRAEESYQRAYSLSHEKELRSDALLGKGNSLAASQDLENAVKAYRKSMIENPSNVAAKNNLMTSLRMLKQQKEQQKDQEGDNKDDENKDQDKKDEKEKDKKSGDEDEKDKKDGDEEEKDKKSGDEDKKDEKEKDKKSGDEDKKDEEEKDKKSGDEDKKEEEEKDKSENAPAKPEEQKTPEEQQKLQAEQLLDALRDQEKSLRPFEMHDNQDNSPPPEKNW